MPFTSKLSFALQVMFFINYALKFKYQPDHSKVKYARCNVKHLHYSKVVYMKRKWKLTEDKHFLSFFAV